MEARRLVTRLLQDHSKEGTFEVGFDAFDDLDILEQRFKEAGCTVEVNPRKRILKITVPND